ncbi:MAG: DUF3416 domain-containing protein, partial [Gemmatimonadetes bacterium]|nr:DUF3416 domain-containing protein [Gemmatimonadota bacterium]
MAGEREARRYIVIEAVSPELDCGRYAVKREVGDSLEVQADIFKEGHDAIAAAIRYRMEGETEWQEQRMHFLENDRWSGTIALDRNARYEYTVVAWTDDFGSWRAELRKKAEAGQNVNSELLEGSGIVESAVSRASGGDQKQLRSELRRLTGKGGMDSQVAVALGEELLEVMERHSARADLTQYERVLPLQVDRVRARFAAWYEIFPRSMSDDPQRHGSFRDVIDKLDYVREMGFDVLYFPPIHPIGKAHRKGKNNSLTAEAGEPGSPYAI